MKWSEFTTLLSGLGEKSALARTVAIRLEDDPEILRNFTSSQRRIRADWRNRQAQRVGQQDLDSFIKEIQQAFASL